jgi:hypothetical protein
MNQTPEDPQGPDTGGGPAGHDGHGPTDAGYPAHPPLEPGATPPSDSPPTDDAITLTPLDEMPTRSRFLSGGRLAVAALLVVALIGGAAAFALGGDDDEPKDQGVASIDGTTGDGEEEESSGNGTGGPKDDTEIYDAMLKFAECMREHGIDMPDPEMGEGGVQMKAGREGGPDAGGPDEEEFEAAHKACEHLMADVRGDKQLSPEEQAEMQDKLVAMAECMRGRGYDMPDPEVAEDGGVMMRMGRGPDGPPKDDEQVQKDQEECSAEAGLEDGGPMGGGGAKGSEGGS